MALFRFLASLQFAILLLAVTAGAVALATFLEGATNSHDFAASYVYSHPLFLALLAGFFINILFSAIRRFPFKKRHFPFLLTHLGLLMVILGTMIKNVCGLQGTMCLQPQESSHSILEEGTFALLVEEDGHQMTYLCDPSKPSGFKGLDTLQLTHYFPHAKPKLETWIKGNKGSILGHTIPLNQTVTLPLMGQMWQVRYELCDDLRAHAKKLAKGLSASYFRSDDETIEENKLYLLDDQEHTLLLFLTKTGGYFFESGDKFDSYYAYDGGHRGYSVEMRVPEHFFLDEKQRLAAIDQPLSDLTTLANWATLVLPHAEEAIQKNEEPLIFSMGWPKPLGWDFVPPSEKITLIHNQLFELKNSLPPIHALNASILPSLSSFDLAPKNLGHRSIETSIACAIEKTDHLQDPPAIVIECAGEKRLLPYQQEGGLKWPLQGKLYRFQRNQREIPHTVTLMEGRKIEYPNSQTVQSYEADVLIDDTPFTLKMNQVFESKEGYRFYLSGLGEKVQLVVNYDPVRYKLTYPGVLLVFLGTCLLFLKRRR